MSEPRKCAHATCSCPVLPLQDFCCDDCKSAYDKQDLGEELLTECHCQHADCGGQPEISAEAQGLLMASEVLAT